MTCPFTPPLIKPLILEQANGGKVLPVEKYADVKIVDHARKEALPGTFVALRKCLFERNNKTGC